MEPWTRPLFRVVGGCEGESVAWWRSPGEVRESVAGGVPDRAGSGCSDGLSTACRMGGTERRCASSEDEGMAVSRVRINALVVDAVDPEGLAAFWSELLGRPVVGRMGPYVWLRRESGLGLGFQRAGGPKSVKNRMHFDVTSPDPGAEQERVEALGGRRLEGYDAGGFLVMADPEGNEFCIIPEGAFELDDEGRADYLV